MERTFSKIIGIDPGLKGSMCVLDKNGGPPVIQRLPTAQRIRANGKVVNTIDTVALSEMLRKLVPDPNDAVCFLEDVHSCPKDGRTAAFTFGGVQVAIQSTIALYGLPTRFIAPSAWKVRMKCTGPKKNARMRCEKLYPAHKHLFKSIDDCEATLIATYGLLFGGLAVE